MSHPTSRSGAARRLAHKVLVRVARDDAYADRVLDTSLQRAAIPVRDRAFATELVYGTLRHQPYLDFLISRTASRPLRKIAIPVLTALRMGAYQIVETRVPDHAAVHETVNLVRSLTPRAAGFANAVLRKLAAQHDTGQLARPDAELDDPLEALSVRGSHPVWILRDLAEHLGAEELKDWVEANNRRPRVSLRANRMRTTRDELAGMLDAAGFDVERPPLFPDGLHVDAAGDVREWPGFAEGLFTVQDLGAQLVARLADPQPGQVVLDACAAPGGKATHLAELIGDQGTVLAVDVHAAKTRLIAGSAARLGLECVKPAVADAGHTDALGDALYDAEIEQVDVAVVDAPCTGLGTLRRNPELRTRRRERVSDLTDLQDSLLDAVASFIRPGGVLVYAVCTVTEAEGVDRVRSFLDAHPDFGVEEPTGAILQPFVDRDGGVPVVRTWTHRHDSDGFFAARLRRKNLAPPAIRR